MHTRYDASIHHRRSIRLPGYDYSGEGAYFVTICVWDGECLLGEVVDGEMVLNDYGRAVADCWEWLAAQYAHVVVDAWVVMPNHTHGIIVLRDEPPDERRGGSRTAPTGQRKPLGRLVGAFKTVSSKRINELRGTPGEPVWQRNYYEHISRDEDELSRIREHIVNNPAKWAEDEDNPTAYLGVAWRCHETHEISVTGSRETEDGREPPPSRANRNWKDLRSHWRS